MLVPCHRKALLLAALLLVPGGAALSAEDPPKSEDAALSSGKDAWRGRMELKREDTDRGTDGEKTKTTLRVEVYPKSSFLALLRLDVPFPDEKADDFEGSPFHPRLGDLKTRLGFVPFKVGGTAVSSFLEATFPTADPESGGSGKYQVTAGLRTSHKLPFAFGQGHKATLSPLLQQVVSVAGDETRKDINYTKLELTFRDTWDLKWIRMSVKPAVDWVQDGKTGAVGEVEFGFGFRRRWSAWLMVGGRLWGDAVASTYGTRVTLGLARMF